MEAIVILSQVYEGAEKLKGYWDETGLDMHIAVKQNGEVAISTKHWVRVHYITTNSSTDQLWEHLANLSNEIGRKLIRSEKGPYVYINKLNIKQTQEVFDKIVKELGASRGDITRVWELSFDIEDAVLPTSK